MDEQKRLERLVGKAVRLLKESDSAGPEAAHQALFEAYLSGREAWSYKLTTLLPDILTWAGMVEHPLHYTDGPVPSVDWIEADLRRYAEQQGFA